MIEFMESKKKLKCKDRELSITKKHINYIENSLKKGIGRYSKQNYMNRQLNQWARFLKLWGKKLNDKTTKIYFFS